MSVVEFYRADAISRAFGEYDRGVHALRDWYDEAMFSGGLGALPPDDVRRVRELEEMLAALRSAIVDAARQDTS